MRLRRFFDPLPPPLRPEEVMPLFRRIRAGDQGARTEAIERNLRLVVQVLNRFLETRSVAQGDLDDLFQAGCLGLMQAVDGFQPERAVRFSSYAVPFILGEIRRAFRRLVAPDLPRSLWQRRGRLLEVREELAQKLGREPTLGEIAAAAGVSSPEVAEGLEQLQPAARLEGADQTVWERSEDRITLEQLMAGLSAGDRLLFRLRFLEGRSQSEVAWRLHVSQPQVSRRERQLLAQLRREAW